VSTVIAPIEEPTRRQRRGRSARRDRRAERRRLKHLDKLSAQLAELFAIEELLDRAVDVVSTGWVQDAWFVVSTSDGQRAVTAYDLRMAMDRPVLGACVVGAVVEAGGGPANVRSQVVQRTLDLTWHTLREGSEEPVRWCPGPRVRMMTVLDLTHWNDTPGRTQDEVVGLLVATRRCAAAQREMCHAEQASLGAAASVS
jgi:hypothetical protein